MIIIGCDFHPSWQQVAWVDTETGETEERKLVHAWGEAQKFYQQLSSPALIGMESTGNCQWFVEMAAAAGHDVWIGDAAQIRASDVRQQKHDKRDAALLLQLLLEGRFPRIWTPSSEQKDLRQLLIHRHKLVGLRSRVKNELQHLALNQGVQKKRKLWSEAGQKVLREIPLQPWADRRREDLLKLLAMLDEQVALLDEAVKKAAGENEKARLLMTQPGVGPVTSLAFVLTMGDVTRFPRGKQVASYLGLIPREYSSGGHQRLGSIIKQGNRFMRMLLVEAAQVAVRCDPQFRNEYLHRCHTKPKGVAKVAAARKLAIRLYWMLRTQKRYPEIVRIESSSRVPLVG
ncbi:MAG TPA: IS110 family transposase [Candidatus Sulfotelmatobacter sp.]|nr:IS110 family transposase [Candidatus Sulfotelmatobacter sp.]